MRLHRLTLTAFGPFRATQTIDFDALSSAGLFLLHGPTGGGKTSVLDAVCFALYGTVPGSREKFTGTLRSDHADPHTATRVVLDLTVGGRRLEITRGPEQLRPKRRGHGLTLEKPHSTLREYPAGGTGWTALSRSHQEIGEEIRQSLGMSRDQFCQVVLLPQGQFARFLRADADTRGHLLGRLFDTRRFAAAERHLTELRRTTSEQVRQGDGELLRLAHRMAQAAGTCADLTDYPLPDLAAGEPQLAETVLSWAAVARTSARERLAAATAAVVAAESAYHGAQRAADTARTVASLQQRHADAQRRAADGERRREESDRTRARLERARAAAVVAPALALRDTAERAHQQALEDERRLRERLPADCVAASAARLVERERACRTALGGLAAARRAEQRATALATELATLEDESRQDDVLLAETARWLAGWQAEQSRLRQAVDTAQAAVGQAEQLAVQHDLARARLDAGQRRQTLTTELAAAEQRLLQARERAVAASQRWLDRRERRLEGIAAELAADLRAGQPCAVCGATAHPHPARPDTGHVDRAAEEAARAEHHTAEAARAEADRAVQAVREALAAAHAGAGTADLQELTATEERLREAHVQAQTAAREVTAAREALDRAERAHDDHLAQRRHAEQRVAARTSRRAALLSERSALEEEVTRARGDAVSVAARVAALERRVALLAEAVEAARAVEDTARRRKDADGRAADAAYQAHFATPRAAADAVLDEATRQALHDRLDQWQSEQATILAELRDPALIEAAAQPPVDPERARRAAERANQRWRELSAVRATAGTRCAELDRLSARAEADARRLAPLRARHALTSRLATLTAGTSTENERRMRLESYVLAARLEQVAAAASTRLTRMSSGRYTLVHSDARAGGRGRQGLGLRIVDAWTGRERDTATLSGGETFFASLALALGLADVVTEEAGGVRLDTLFIDEGFGSLDEQTLDDVLDVLDSLRERNRSVGIVSHVPDLRQRVPAQLEIRKTRTGSTVRHHQVPWDA